MKPLALVLFLTCSSFLHSLDPMAFQSEPLLDILGMEPAQAWLDLGPPISLYLASDMDDYPVVATVHHNGVQLYWFQDRVWQIQFSQDWTGSLWEIQIGDTRRDVMEQLGAPFVEATEMMLYSLPDIGFPMELRIYLDLNGYISDLILYRSDF